MPFAKGHEKYGGNKAGVPPKASITLATVKATCERLGCDPFRILANIALDDKCATKLRLDAAKELCGYLAPKLKAIDHTFGGSGTLNTHDTGTELLASRIASLASKLGTGSTDPKPE